MITVLQNNASPEMSPWCFELFCSPFAVIISHTKSQVWTDSWTSCTDLFLNAICREDPVYMRYQRPHIVLNPDGIVSLAEISLFLCLKKSDNNSFELPRSFSAHNSVANVFNAAVLSAWRRHHCSFAGDSSKLGSSI